MKILITGASGFVGSYLSDYLLKLGHHVIGVNRSKKKTLPDHDNFNFIPADTTKPGQWQDALRDVDAVVNLAGASIFRPPWTDNYKKIMYDSRVLTTRNIVDALPTDNNITLCSTSAVGFYGDRGEEILDEESGNGNDFLANLCADWEAEAYKAREKKTRVVTTRFGVILGEEGGAVDIMKLPFKFYVGGVIGDGKQWFPWIHIDDLMSGIWFVLENIEMDGPFNLCSPNPVRNRELTRAMGEALHRPTFIPVPAFVIKTTLGEFGQIVLYSQRAVPKRLMDHDFHFDYPEIDRALKDVV